MVDNSGPTEAGNQRIAMFLEILAAAGGVQDASDYRWNWINAFCSEHEGAEPDTFNRAHDAGYTTVSHDSDTDQSTVYITDKGRAAIHALREGTPAMSTTPTITQAEPIALLHEHPDSTKELELYRHGAGCLTDADRKAGWTETRLYSEASLADLQDKANRLAEYVTDLDKAQQTIAALRAIAEGIEE